MIYFLLDMMFLAAFVPAVGSTYAPDVASIASLLVASLIVGFVFAAQIKESRLGSAGKIAVVFAVFSLLITMAIGASNFPM